MGERVGAYRVLVGKLEGRRPLGIPRRILEDNIKVDLQEGRWGQEELIRLRIRINGRYS